LAAVKNVIVKRNFNILSKEGLKRMCDPVPNEIFEIFHYLLTTR